MSASAVRRLVVEEFGAPEVLRLVEEPEPDPGDEDVVVRVVSAAVNWIDVSLRSGRLAGAGLLGPAPRYGLGWDVSGIVERTGRAVRGLDVGRPVVGLRDVLGLPGTHADHVTLHQSAVVPAPRRLDPVESGALPLAGVTAIGALEDGGLSPGQTVLVTGAGGAVGGAAVAVSLLGGARVVAVARSHDLGRLSDRGALPVDVDADGGPSTLARRVRRLVPSGVDLVVDAATLGPAAHETVRGGGTFVALVRPFAPAPVRGTRVVVHEAHADPVRLRRAVALADEGVVTVGVAAAYPLADAASAHRLLDAGGVRGRVVLTP